MKEMTKRVQLVLAAALAAGLAACARPLTLADPFILLDGGRYYAYGTGRADGIAVAVSDDLSTWTPDAGRAAGGLALHKDDSYGERGFWAPEVYRRFVIPRGIQPA